MLWDKSFEIGCEKVDNQHRELIALVADFGNSISKNVSGLRLTEILKFLVKYTKHHFSTEENFMRNISYPEFETHRQIHDLLIDEVTSILLNIKREVSIEPQKLYEFLVGWVQIHVLEEDRKIGEFYRQKFSPSPVCAFHDLDEAFCERLAKLQDLFRKRLVSSDDFQEKKFEILMEKFQNFGIQSFRQFYLGLEKLESENLICANEKHQIARKFFADLKIDKALSFCDEIDEKLFILRIYEDFGLASAAEIFYERKLVLKGL